MKIRVEGDLVGQRLDAMLASRQTYYTRNQWQNVIASGKVLLEGKVARASVRLAEGQEVVAPSEQTGPSSILQPKAPHDEIAVLYEDSTVIVINKPAGVSAHPGDGAAKEATVADIFANKVSYSDPDGRAGIVHRLDKDTSGVMVLARTAEALEFLQQQFQARTVEKHYTALVWGQLKQSQARIELPIGRHPKVHTRMAVVPEGRMAISEYALERAYSDYSLIDVLLLTGRTHQIRVHMAYLGNPVVGDKVYGKRVNPDGLTRQFLHAKSLHLTLPNNVDHTFVAPLPSELQYFLEELV